MLGLVLAFLLAVLLIYKTIPLENTSQSHFDSIIVLGYPANRDGTPSPIQRERVGEAVREYRAGIAPHMIMTGGPAHNKYTEAEVMAAFAESLGVPSTVILEEKQAQNTIQNAYYSMQVLNAQGWKSAEIVSSGSHLARASLIFSHFPIQYKIHAAKPVADSPLLYEYGAWIREIESTDRLRLFGFRRSRYLP